MKWFGLILLILFFSCMAHRRSKIHEPRDMEKMFGCPPGTMSIGDNEYIDKAPVDNFSYLEFLYWTRRVKGDSIYRRMLPDTTIWERISSGSDAEDMKAHYLREKKYRKSPVVGVSRQQAIEFSMWRSNRVTEFILIRLHLRKHDPKPTAESAFSIGSVPVAPIPYFALYTVHNEGSFSENQFRCFCTWQKW